ncbi:hypothetical protein NQZ68_034107 [Dissostichus eleginoides]|nr:hypothetical protein NQZ68_034107 [Dissostichus eleginoides]
MSLRVLVCGPDEPQGVGLVLVCGSDEPQDGIRSLQSNSSALRNLTLFWFPIIAEDVERLNYTVISGCRPDPPPPVPRTTWPRHMISCHLTPGSRRQVSGVTTPAASLSAGSSNPKGSLGFKHWREHAMGGVAKDWEVWLKTGRCG